MSISSDDIRQHARALGFQGVGISRVEPLADETRYLSEWLNRGFHATMTWIARNGEKRTDPGKILPGARSVISVAMNYYTGAQHEPGPSKGKISRYAWGDDYHDVVGNRLNLLNEFMTSREPEARGMVYVDTGPILEKVWAQRAGIGWLGKHTNLITQDHGSWVFLGEILSTLDLEPDVPETDHCGSCTLCIEACPTDAITAPYVLDAGRCISYLTIEHRGNLPEELEGELSGWIYGCDICQDVCPWNQRFSQITPEPAFAPRQNNISPGLESIAGMTLDEFNARYQRSPIKRTKHSGLTRNARANLHHQTTMTNQKESQDGQPL
jgi:epoxyqueuosine reductase